MGYRNVTKTDNRSTWCYFLPDTDPRSNARNTTQVLNMTEPNPYEASNTMGQQSLPYSNIAFAPIQYMKRSYRMMQERYFLFLGITLCGMLVGACGPFGILLGPMITGVYLCFLQHESGETVKFDTLFQGFHRFVPALLVTLAALLCNILVSFVLIILFASAAVLFVILIGDGSMNGIAASFVGIVFAVAYILLLLMTFLAFVPFAFCFQLIAEHNMSAGTAIQTSFNAARHNLAPLAFTYLCLSLFGMVAALFCYVPMLFLMPIQLGATFIIYRDTFPKPEMTGTTQPPVTPN